MNVSVTGARVIDPKRGLDAVGDVHVAGGLMAEAPAPGAATIDARGLIVAPGLIDLHTHVYADATSLGVEPEPLALRSGCATLVDAGSAGAGNVKGLARFVAEPSPVRILAFLNVSFAGIFGFGRRVMVGECADLRLLDIQDCVEAARVFPGFVVGVKVRAGRNAGGSSGIAPVRMAIEAAEELGLPVMAHVDFPPPGRDEVLEALRPGDILTHCCRGFPNSAVTSAKAVRETVRVARERGVLFDVGHGMGSFSFEAARAMLEGGFVPDAVSSDVHALCEHGPAFDNLVTLTKFLHLGLPLADAIACATSGPAKALRRPDLGTLAPGSAGDVTLLSIIEGEFPLTDSEGRTLNAERRLKVEGLIVGGRILRWPSR